MKLIDKPWIIFGSSYYYIPGNDYLLRDTNYLLYFYEKRAGYV